MKKTSFFSTLICLVSSIFIACEKPAEQELLKLPISHRPHINEGLLKAFPKFQNLKIEPLIGGLSRSALFVLNIDGKKYVLRLIDPKKCQTKRQSEVIMHQAAASIGIAPKIAYIDDLKNPLIIIMDFIEGRTLTPKDFDNHEIMQKLMIALKKIHGLKDLQLRTTTKMDDIERNYKQCIEKNGIFPSHFKDYLIKLRQDFDAIKGSICPVHGDFTIRNTLLTKTGDIFVIDFSEAFQGNPLLDIGWCAGLSGATKQQTLMLLKTYLQREPSKDEIKDTFFFKKMSYFLAAIWIGKKPVKDQETLDKILSNPIKKGTDNVRDELPTETVKNLEGIEFTIYSLGWFKDFLETI